jgi:hypothetical protein
MTPRRSPPDRRPGFLRSAPTFDVRQPPLGFRVAAPQPKASVDEDGGGTPSTEQLLPIWIKIVFETAGLSVERRADGQNIQLSLHEVPSVKSGHLIRIRVFETELQEAFFAADMHLVIKDRNSSVTPGDIRAFPRSSRKQHLSIEDLGVQSGGMTERFVPAPNRVHQGLSS